MEIKPFARLVSTEGDDAEQADSDEEELREALVDYMATANQERTLDNQNTDAGEPGTSDSDDDRQAHGVGSIRRRCSRDLAVI